MGCRVKLAQLFSHLYEVEVVACSGTMALTARHIQCFLVVVFLTFSIASCLDLSREETASVFKTESESQLDVRKGKSKSG